ncbi:MAG: potassium-transporting ATPase subunit KdpA [Jatrophihabitans sp.]
MAGGIAQLVLLLVALGFAYRYLGGYIARVFTSEKHTRAERVTYRLLGVDREADQTWPVYLRSVLAFSAMGVLLLYLLQRVQSHLPLSLGHPGVAPSTAWNTAASFVTNTNWQSYVPETTMGHLVQFAGLAVQNFVSAAVGIAVSIALVRGFRRARTNRLGNFWVDLVRACYRLLLPLAVVVAVLLMVGGVIQNFHGFTEITTLGGGHQMIPGGPVASQEAIKELGNNGGGFLNANASHPFENPGGWTNWLEVLAILIIPVSLPRAFGVMVGDKRQGHAILAAMTVIWALSVAGIWAAESAHHGTAPRLAGAALEGKELRFGIPGTALFSASTTLTSTGAIDAQHDSLTSLGGGVTLVDMMTGEVAPGGAGAGLYGILIIAVLAVFIAGLMVGRTPEYLGKKISTREIKMASLYILATPLCLLTGAATAMSIKSVRASMENSGPHGLSEMLYAFTSASNNNGSAFAGLSANTTFLNTALGLCMLLARFLPIVFVLALAGSLARQAPVPVTAGTLPTHRPQFVGLVVGVIVIVTLLTYAPALALGPLAEGLH